ncbi:MAG: LysR family transcriptional regulator [Burkholderiales bacterium]|jgi:DNA-binding transcriptional LysR family regulator|nr:LysR family transcriptional regulator [Burkholderiales bacterium]
MSLTIRQIKYFVATAELGQVSQAAHHLNISQSAVTTAIQDLEATLGTALFQRTPTGMDLTESGRRFLNHAYTVLAAVDDALRVAPAPDEIDGDLSVAATYTVIGYFLPHHLQRFAQLHPQIRVRLHEVTREQVEEGLIDQRHDLGVVLTSNVKNSELASETLMASARRLWVPARHPLLQQADVRLADVAREPYIMLTVDEAAQTTLRYWSRTPYLPDVRLRTASVEAVRSMVANGLGVAILSDLVYRPWSLEGKRIETVMLKDVVPSMDVGLAWKKHRPLSAPMAAFREYFRQVYADAAFTGARSRAA